MAYVTKQSQAVLRCLEGRETEALTAAEISDELRRAGQTVGLATIYRQLERLEAAGLVHKIPTEEGALYQRCSHPEADHACFLLRCERCGRVTHLDCGQLESLCRHLESAHQFRIDARQTVLTGRCRDCVKQEDDYGTP